MTRTTWQWTAGAFLLAFLGWPVTALMAPPRVGNWTFFNNSAFPVYVAITEGKGIDWSQVNYSKGWWLVQPGSSITFDRAYSPSEAYYYVAIRVHLYGKCTTRESGDNLAWGSYSEDKFQYGEGEDYPRDKAKYGAYEVVRGNQYEFNYTSLVPPIPVPTPKTEDNFTTATAAGEVSVGNRYGFVRIEGYVYPNQQPGTVPLKLFYKPPQ
jgi:hypothetical protein